MHCLLAPYHLFGNSSHDLNYFGKKFLQQDLIKIMKKLIPTCGTGGQYLHPEPRHIEFAVFEL